MGIVYDPSIPQGSPTVGWKCRNESVEMNTTHIRYQLWKKFEFPVNNNVFFCRDTIKCFYFVTYNEFISSNRIHWMHLRGYLNDPEDVPLFSLSLRNLYFCIY